MHIFSRSNTKFCCSAALSFATHSSHAFLRAAHAGEAAFARDDVAELEHGGHERARRSGVRGAGEREREHEALRALCGRERRGQAYARLCTSRTCPR